MALSDSMNQMISLINDTVTDYHSALEGNKAASVRVRKNMLQIKRLTQKVRVEMLECRQKKSSDKNVDQA